MKVGEWLDRPRQGMRSTLQVSDYLFPEGLHQIRQCLGIGLLESPGPLGTRLQQLRQRVGGLRLGFLAWIVV